MQVRVKGLVAGDYHIQSFILKARKTAFKDIEGMLSNHLDMVSHLSQPRPSNFVPVMIALRPTWWG